MDNNSFNELVVSSTRPDGYVDATKWCKHFNYRLARWKELPETKARTNKLAQNQSIKPWIIEGKGRSARTFVHPVMAIHLASYLSPEFANYVAQTFQRYLEADATLAIEIIDRNNNPEDLKKIEQRARTKLSNRGVNAAIKLCGGEKVYPVVADLNNVAVTGQTAKDIKLARNVKQTRDGMSLFELSMIEAAENLEEAALRNKRPKGDKPIAEVCRAVADDIHALVKKYTTQ
jgi:hypothetical protein